MGSKTRENHHDERRRQALKDLLRVSREGNVFKPLGDRGVNLDAWKKKIEKEAWGDDAPSSDSEPSPASSGSISKRKMTRWDWLVLVVIFLFVLFMLSKFA